MADLTGRKPILGLDFDGVCHSYASGWKGAATIPDAPVEGTFDALKDYADHFELNVYSARSNQEGGIQAMRDWFEKHEPGITNILRFPTDKPPAFVSIDDRVITFTGQWPSVEMLQAFKPWNAKNV